MDFRDVEKICFGYTTNGLHNMADVADEPFRFILTSGISAERDQNQILYPMGQYRLMRVCIPSSVHRSFELMKPLQGRVETALLDYAFRHPYVQVTIAKPALIDGPGRNYTNLSPEMKELIGDAPIVHVSELAAALIDQALNGITKEPLTASDLKMIGSNALREELYVH